MNNQVPLPPDNFNPEDQNSKKQTMIAIIFIFVIVGISFGIFTFFKKTVEPSILENSKLKLTAEDLKKDSDLDGLMDVEENFYATDINKSDSDNDGYSDFDEVNNGYNPAGNGILDKATLDSIDRNKKDYINSQNDFIANNGGESTSSLTLKMKSIFSVAGMTALFISFVSFIIGLFVFAYILNFVCKSIFKIHEATIEIALKISLFQAGIVILYNIIAGTILSVFSNIFLYLILSVVSLIFGLWVLNFYLNKYYRRGTLKNIQIIIVTALILLVIYGIIFYILGFILAFIFSAFGNQSGYFM